MAEKWTKGAYEISTDPARLNIAMIHEYLSTGTYWAAGRPLDVVQRGIENSLSFGIFKGKEQVGFARIVTDYATFAWLADVFVLESFQGQGLATWLMSVIIAHPRLQGLRRWLLATKDAHSLYAQFGFSALHAPERMMERFAEQVKPRFGP